MAATPPVRLSIATSAALGPTPVRYWSTASLAIFCRSRSSVVLIFSPPANARWAPKRSTTCCLTQVVKYGACESSRGGRMSSLAGMASWTLWL
jgi:hypothetical protein